jgi:hypothetical protein
VGTQFSADRSIRIAAPILSVLSDCYTRTEHTFTLTPGTFGRLDIRENTDSPTQSYIVKVSVLKAIMILGLVPWPRRDDYDHAIAKKQVCSCPVRRFRRFRSRFAVSCGRARKCIAPR